MDLEKYLGWSSPIGAFLILTGLGIFFYLGTLALQILTHL
jgi:hypothetical protein